MDCVLHTKKVNWNKKLYKYFKLHGFFHLFNKLSEWRANGKLLFTDEAVLLSEDPVSLQGLLNRLNSYYLYYF